MAGHKSSSKLPISQCKERNMTHYISHRVCELRTNQDFPGGRVIKIHPPNAGGTGSIGAQERSSMPWSKKKNNSHQYLGGTNTIPGTETWEKFLL